jgi:hypothetical protein
MPHKHNADRRHHIPKKAFKVQNWPTYESRAAAWQPDVLDRGWRAGTLAELWTQRAGPLRGRGHPDHLVVRAAFKLAFVRGLRIGSRCRTAHEVA